MIECVKRNNCNAPYCPLDPHRAHVTTLRGEASCLYLREAVKPGGRIPEQLRPAIDEALPLVLNGTEGGAPLRKALQRAASCGSSRNRTTAL